MQHQSGRLHGKPNTIDISCRCIWNRSILATIYECTTYQKQVDNPPFVSSAGFTQLSERAKKEMLIGATDSKAIQPWSDIIGPSCAARHPRTCISPFFFIVDSHSTTVSTVTDESEAFSEEPPTEPGQNNNNWHVKMHTS